MRIVTGNPLTSPVPSSPCPHCGLKIKTSTWHDGWHIPEDGDLTICAHCVHILRFDKHRKLRALTERDERAMIASDPDIARMMREIASRHLSAMFAK